MSALASVRLVSSAYILGSEYVRQCGFRSLHSTLTALIEATDSWALDIDRGLVNAVVFLDLKKAFDTVDHDILLRLGLGPARLLFVKIAMYSYA